MNPIRKYSSNVFASRGCDIDEAMQDAFDTIQRINESDRAHAMTALMIVVNTAANAFDQAKGPSPEKLAVLDLIHSVVGERIAQAQGTMEEMIDEKIGEWMQDNLSDRVQDYLSDNIDVDNSIDEWMNDNLSERMQGEDLCEAIRDAFRNNLTLSIT